MESKVNEILRGFFWGTGFSVSVLLCASAYFISVLPQVDASYKDVALNRTIDSLEQVAKDYEVNVLDIYKSKGQLKVTASVENLTDDEVYGKGIKIELFSVAERFIGSCSSERGDLFIKPKGMTFHEVTCKLFPNQVAEVTTATATLSLL